MTDHREHVHGEWYDRGGELHAEHGPEIVNFSDRPEPILTERQWDDIRRINNQK